MTEISELSFSNLHAAAEGHKADPLAFVMFIRSAAVGKLIAGSIVMLVTINNTSQNPQ